MPRTARKISESGILTNNCKINFDAVDIIYDVEKVINNIKN